MRVKGYWKITITYSNRSIHASYNIDTSITACCALLSTSFLWRDMFANIFRDALRITQCVQADRMEKSVFRIAGYPHSRPVKLARLAKDRVAFNGGEDKLIIRNSAGAKIPQSPPPTSRVRRVDRNIEPQRRRLLSAIPPVQKSAGTLRKYKVEVSFLPSFSRRICDQLFAIDNDDTNGRVMEIHGNPSGPWIHELGYTDWKYLLTNVQPMRDQSLNYTSARKLYWSCWFPKGWKL